MIKRVAAVLAAATITLTGLATPVQASGNTWGTGGVHVQANLDYDEIDCTPNGWAWHGQMTAPGGWGKADYCPGDAPSASTNGLFAAIDNAPDGFCVAVFTRTAPGANFQRVTANACGYGYVRKGTPPMAYVEQARLILTYNYPVGHPNYNRWGNSGFIFFDR